MPTHRPAMSAPMERYTIHKARPDLRFERAVFWATLGLCALVLIAG